MNKLPDAGDPCFGATFNIWKHKIFFFFTYYILRCHLLWERCPTSMPFLLTYTWLVNSNFICTGGIRGNFISIRRARKSIEFLRWKNMSHFHHRLQEELSAVFSVNITTCQYNRPVQSTFSLFSGQVLLPNFSWSYENEISFTCRLNSFLFKWLWTRSRFDTEA